MRSHPAKPATLSVKETVSIRPEPEVAPLWVRPLMLGLAALFIFAFCSTDVSDPDTWWHLKTGEYIVQKHALPVPDPFAFTTYMGKPAYAGEESTRDFNLTHEWLWQVIMYLTYAATGFTGLVLLRCAMIVAFCGLVGLAAYRRTKSFYWIVGAALAALTVAGQFRADRPYLITYAFLAATLVILEYRRWMWLLPPMFVIWANSHGGFFMGWVLLGIYCGEALYQRFRGKPPEGERLLWLVSIICLLASGLNPNGFKFIPVMLAYRASIMQSAVWEWQYPAPWPPSPFMMLNVCALVVLVWQRRRTRPVDWLLLLVFGAASMTAVRNIILSALVGPFLIASYFPFRKALPVKAQYGAAALLVLAIGGQIAQGRSFQFHAADWKYSKGAADFLLAHHIRGRIFNTYELGGYLIWRLWPMEQVFIDGRALNESVYLDYQRIAFNADETGGKSGEELLRQYGIEVIVMDGFEFTSGQAYLLPAALSDPKQTEWKLVYQDNQAVVYMRHPPPDVTPLNSYDALSAMEQQCTTYVQNDPGRPKCADGLAQLFTRIGDTARARKWQQIYGQSPN